MCLFHCWVLKPRKRSNPAYKPMGANNKDVKQRERNTKIEKTLSSLRSPSIASPLEPFVVRSWSWITVLTPAYEHYNTSPHDVKACPLLLHQPSTLASKSTLSTTMSGTGILHERGTWAAPPWWWWPFFLWQLPLLIEVERWGTTLMSATTTCGCRSSRISHVGQHFNKAPTKKKKKKLLCVLGIESDKENRIGW